MGNSTRQKNKRGYRKVESNDSPEIPDRGKTPDIPGLALGDIRRAMWGSSAVFKSFFTV